MLCAGQVYHATVTVHDLDSPPSGAALVISKPDGTAVTPAPIIGAPAQSGRDYTFSYDFPMPAAGIWKFAWTTTSPVTAPAPDYIAVRDFRSAISLAEAKDYLNVTDALRDNLIQALMMAATEEAEKITGTIIIKTVTDEWVNGSYKDVIQLQEGPLPSAASVTSLTSVWPGGPSWALADLIVNPEAATLRARDMLGFWWGPWQVTYQPGRQDVAESIRLGVREILWDLWTPLRGTSGDEAYPDAAEATAYEYQVPAGYQMPPRALARLEPYRRPGFG